MDKNRTARKALHYTHYPPLTLYVGSAEKHIYLHYKTKESNF